MQSDPNFDIKFVLYLNENKFAGLDFDDVGGLAKQKQIDLLATQSGYPIQQVSTSNMTLSLDCNPNTRVISKHGYKYIGPLDSDGEPCGLGAILYENQTRYYGKVVAGQRHGLGSSIDENGNVTHRGNFENDVPHGYGRSETSNGSYEGNFINGERQGYGRFTDRDHTYLEGQFVEGFAQGLGVETYLSGKKWTGTFSDGDKNGPG